MIERTFFFGLLVLAAQSASAGANIAADLYRPLYEAQIGAKVPVTDLTNTSISNNCSLVFDGLLNKATRGEGVLALDSFGKPGAGLLVGNWAWFGHFTECSNLQDYKYCLLSMEVNAKELHMDGLLKLEKIPIEWGICPPRNCSTEEVVGKIQELLDFLHLSYEGINLVNVSAAATCVEKPVVPYDGGFIITMLICAVLGLLMTAGTIIDVIETNLKKEHDGALSVQSGDIAPLMAGQPKEGANGEVNGDVRPEAYYQLAQVETGWRRVVKKFLSGVRLICLDFAFNRNLAKLMKIGTTHKRNIDCLNGIRVLSMFWVILGHVYFFPTTYKAIMNYPDALGLTKNFLFQIVLNGFFSVDSFFFLSGLLVCYLTLVRLESKNGKLPWAWFIVHRYLRLTPVLIAAMLIWMYIAPYTLWGPKAGVLAQRPFCPTYWWTNLLYIQNFYPYKFGHACIAWTWYLANDMQFFIISPFIIYALYRIPFLGLGLIGALLATSMAVAGALTAVHDFPASATSAILDPTQIAGDFGSMMYQAPHIRIPPYLIGMLLGYVMYRFKDRNFTLNRVQLAVGWFLATGIGMSTLFGLMRNFRGHETGEAGNIVYAMLSRTAWASFLAWVVVACRFGTPGWVSNFLCWRFWIPLSRLTYTAYLLHPIVINTFLGNLATSYFVSNVLQVFYFFGALVVSYLCAIVLSLAVEFPLANLEKHLLPSM